MTLLVVVLSLAVASPVVICLAIRRWAPRDDPRKRDAELLAGGGSISEAP